MAHVPLRAHMPNRAKVNGLIVDTMDMSMMPLHNIQRERGGHLDGNCTQFRLFYTLILDRCPNLCSPNLA